MLDGWLAMLTALGVFDGSMLARAGVRPPTAGGLRSRSPTRSPSPRRSAAAHKAGAASAANRAGSAGTAPSTRGGEPRRPTTDGRSGGSRAGTAAVRAARLKTLSNAQNAGARGGLQSPTASDPKSALALDLPLEDEVAAIASPTAGVVAIERVAAEVRPLSRPSTAATAIAAAAAVAAAQATRSEFTEVRVGKLVVKCHL